MGKTTPNEGVASKAKKAGGAGTKAKGENTIREKILNGLLQSYKCGQAVDNEKLAKLCGCHVRTKSYVATKKTLETEGIMGKGGEGFYLTESGAEQAGFVKQDLSKFTTDSEYHGFLKTTFTQKWKSTQIFDLLLEKGPTSRKDLCDAIGIKSGSHSFSYGLKELKDLGYVIKNKSNLCELTEKASIEKKNKKDKSND